MSAVVEGSTLSSVEESPFLEGIDSEEYHPLKPDDTILIVAFELPVRVQRLWDPEKETKTVFTEADFTVSHTHQLVLPGLHKLRRSFGCQTKFVGYCGLITTNEAEQELITRILEAFDCYPVFPDPDMFDKYVEFCYKCLSPLFHSVLQLNCRSQEDPFDPGLWSVYQTMNRIWADVAMHETSSDDIFWIHDYQLLLVPQYISRRSKAANIGLFLHCPFPSVDLFRCLPYREEILRATLCSDLVGFHFFEYLRHYLVGCKRLLGLDHQFSLGGFMGLNYLGRQVMVRIGHVNVEYNTMMKDLAERSDIRRISEEVLRQHEGKFLFASVDRCDQLAGLMLKMKAYRRYLMDFPYARNRVVLIQYAYPPRSAGAEARSFGLYLLEQAEKINAEFGPGHIVLKVQPVTPEEKWGVLRVADAIVDTSVRDGLNLIAYEYMACRGSNPSFMILSEFTGCSATLSSAIRINPWQIYEVAAQMDAAFSLQSSSMTEKWARDQAYLSQNSLEAWATDFISDLRRARKVSRKVYMQCGFGKNIRMLSLDDSFKSLDVEAAVKCFRSAKKKRLLFFDHEGTLAPDRRRCATVPGGTQDLSATGSPPSSLVKARLASLCQDPNNLVFIFSGRDRKLLDTWFGGIPNIGLCAEHGFYIKSKLFNDGSWRCMSSLRNFSWKKIAMKLMSQYVKRTQGAFIENKGSALVFQYRNADPDFGSWQAKELGTHLEDFLFGMPVVVVNGKGYVECRVAGVSKGVTVNWILNQVPDVGFVLCIGDDSSDEEMFNAIHRFFENSPANTEPTTAPQKAAVVASFSNFYSKTIGQDDEDEGPSWQAATDIQTLGDAAATAAPPLTTIGSPASSAPAPSNMPGDVRYFTVTVGKKPSAAHYFLNDTDEVSEVLGAFAPNAHADEDRRNENTPPTFCSSAGIGETPHWMRFLA